MKQKAFCPKCGQYTSVKIKERFVIEKVRDIVFHYDEQYAVCKKCHEEVYMDSVNDTNCYRRYIAYGNKRDK